MSSPRDTIARLAAAPLALAWAASAAAADVTLTASEFAFEPGTVTVEEGERVRVVLENMGVLAHNVTIPALDAGTATIQSAKAAVVEFTAPEPGRYEIVCTVPGHEEAGMRATLRVE